MNTNINTDNKEKSVFTYNNKQYFHSDIINIGNSVISLSGGSCYDYTFKIKKKQIIFYCLKNNEKFETTITFDEIKQYE